MASQSLAARYKSFLASPSSSLLADKASLHYITTTTTFAGSTDIIKHIGNTVSQLSKKKEEFLTTVENNGLLAAEVETTISFSTGGGAYIPGIDDNFLADHTVGFIVNHMVLFDNNGQISNIRLSWDQGGLLKQLDIIGKTGRNWPLRDSREQLNIVTASLRSLGQTFTSTKNELPMRSGGNSNALRDPHAPLASSDPREEVVKSADAVVFPYAGARPHQRSFSEILGADSKDAISSTPAVISPYAGRRPPQRTMTDILRDDGPEDEFITSTASRERSRSPTKSIVHKVGAGKNFHPSRLFDNDDMPQENFNRSNMRTYEHFDMADPPDIPRPGLQLEKKPKSKHDSNWSFEDFATPQKAMPAKIVRHQHQDVRHWDTEGIATETPGRQPPPTKPRRDAETHFELQNDGFLPEGSQPISRPRGSMQNTGLRLYDDKAYAEESGVPNAGPPALGNITNLKDRKKELDVHFTMSDNSPSQQAPQTPRMMSDDRKMAVKMMEHNWSARDDSPVSQKENNPRFNAAVNTVASGFGHNNAIKNEGGRRIVIAGDGMGGKMGTTHDWLYGEEKTPKAVPGKKPGANPSTIMSHEMWDF